MTVDGVEYVPAMDANGNVKALFNANDGSIAAQFEYSAFGEVIQATGSAANVCPFGFSTKYTDAETGFAYYGFRYYAPSAGRWLSRDPIAERGGLNLYGMVGNNPVSEFDILGLAPALDSVDASPEAAQIWAALDGQAGTATRAAVENAAQRLVAENTARIAADEASGRTAQLIAAALAATTTTAFG